MDRNDINAEFRELCKIYGINAKMITDNVPGLSKRTVERWFSESQFNISPMALAWLKLFIQTKGLNPINH